MNLWRISNHLDLLGLGGLYASGRWHTAGRPVVYLAENPSAALLEVLVHLELETSDIPRQYKLLKIEVDTGTSKSEVAELAPSWKSAERDTQSKGDAWIESRESALLRVPSALTPETWNWLLNPRHSDASGLRLAAVYHELYDPRLL